jgi:hypothetical protein
MDREMSIEEILDICLEKMKEGVSLDEVLTEYLDYRGELRELLTIAGDIDNTPLPHVRDKAVVSCLKKVNKALQSKKKQAWRDKLPRLQWPRLFHFPSPAWAKPLAFVLIVILISWSTASLSGDSLPGDILYPIKLTTEKVRFYLTTDPEGKAELRLVYSEERMRELVRYLDEKKKLNTQVLKAMLDEAALAVDNISRLPKDKAIVCCLKLEYLCAFHKDVLERLKSKVPSSQSQELDNAIQACHHRMEWMGKVRRNEVPMGEWGPFVLNET